MAPPKYVLEPITYLEKCVGGRYIVWTSGHFFDGPPAWMSNTKPPSASEVRAKGSFCAGMLNLAQRVNGLHVFQDTALSWAGGVKWWGERLSHKGVFKTSNRLDYDPGTLFIKPYTGAALGKQGHVAIMGRHGKLLQADFFGDAFDGINESRTLYQTNQWLKYWDGSGFDYYVNPADWLK